MIHPVDSYQYKKFEEVVTALKRSQGRPILFVSSTQGLANDFFNTFYHQFERHGVKPFRKSSDGVFVFHVGDNILQTQIHCFSLKAEIRGFRNSTIIEYDPP